MAAVPGLRALRRLCGVALFLSQLYVLSGRGERGRRRFARAPRGGDGVGRWEKGGQGRELPPAHGPAAGSGGLRPPLGAGGLVAPQRLACWRGPLSRVPSAEPRGGTERAPDGSGF